jgi:hypothetical protein
MTDWIKLRDKLIRQVPWQASSLLAHAGATKQEKLPDLEDEQVEVKFAQSTGLSLHICTEGVKQIRAALNGGEPDEEELDPWEEDEPEEDEPEEDEPEEDEPEEDEPEEDEPEEDEPEEEVASTEESLSAMSKQELYARATRLNVEGRSSMSKGELVEAILEADEE